MSVPAPPPLPDGCPLTPREWQVLWLDGVWFLRSKKQIAAVLGVSASSVRVTLYRARLRLGADSNWEARKIVGSGRWPRRIDAREPVLTPAQTLYLDEFDKYLASGEARFGESSDGMKHHLKSMCMERGMGQPKRSQRSPWKNLQPA